MTRKLIICTQCSQCGKRLMTGVASSEFEDEVLIEVAPCSHCTEAAEEDAFKKGSETTGDKT